MQKCELCRLAHLNSSQKERDKISTFIFLFSRFILRIFSFKKSFFVRKTGFFYLSVFCSPSQYRIQNSECKGRRRIDLQITVSSHFFETVSEYFRYRDTFTKNNIESNFFHKTFFILYSAFSLCIILSTFFLPFLEKNLPFLYATQLFRGNCSLIVFRFF